MTEDALAEQPALEWLAEVGWSYKHGVALAPDIAPAERVSWADVVLRTRLTHAIARLNPELPPRAIADVVGVVLAPASPNVVEDHAALHDLLLNGVRASYSDARGERRDVLTRLIDWDDVAGNEFTAVNQLTIVTGQKNRRPDILLFVNGLPLGQIELKAPGSASATAESAVNQVRAYQEVMPQLYRFVELVGVSDLATARVGTLTSATEHFAPWRSMDPADDEGLSQLEVMIRGVFAPARLLELIRGFVAFQVFGPRLVKVLAKYHQVDAVRKALTATREAMASDGRAGVVWHTQGAGKSLTMVFYAQAVRRDSVFANPTIVAVTDRRDLDDQLHRTFAQQRGLSESVRRADEIAGGPESLRELLDVPAGGIVFTTIQKFKPLRGETAMPVLSERRNVIVMADEAHRTQYSDLARNLAIALPNATRIGFTGTPIESADRSTGMVFGDYVSVYPIARAVADGATVPIYYESRRIPIDIADEELLDEVDDALEAEDEAAARRLSTRWAQLERVVGADDRVRRIADDVAAHYLARCEEQDGKALVVAMSRDIASRLTALLKEVLGAEAVTCVMSVAPADAPEMHGPGGEYRRSRAELEQVALDFKDPAYPLRVVVVRDMWLTGFDAPCLHTLYVDKPMRDHGLLQAIARVNRVFGDKPGGLVVDYIGIGEDLRKSLAAYDQKDVDKAMISLDEAMTRLREKHEIVCSMLHGLDWSRFGASGASAAERSTVVLRCVDFVLAEPDLPERFLKQQALASRWHKLARTHPDAAPLASDLLLFKATAGLIRKVEIGGAHSASTEQTLRQFFSEGLAAGEIVDIIELADGRRPEISILSDEFLDTLKQRISQEYLRRQLMQKLLNDEIQATGKRNPAQGQLFAERLRGVLARYQNRQLTSKEVLDELIRLAKDLRDARARQEQLGLSPEEAAFYDALADDSETGAIDARVAEIAQELVQRIRSSISVDWQNREQTRAEMRRTIRRLLRKHRFKGPVRLGGGRQAVDLDEIVELLMHQATVLYATFPELEPV